MPSRDLTLKPRKEGVRDKKSVKSDGAVRFTLDAIYRHFQETLSDIENLFAVASLLDAQERSGERDSMWRTQIVFLAGAFDFFMHEITKYGLTQILCGVWAKTSKYKNLSINMGTVELGLQADIEDVAWFYDYVNVHFSTHTMISHAEVKEQLNLLGINQSVLARKAFYSQGDTKPVSEKLKERLNQLFQRRNLIAHQVDRAHKDARLLPIDEATVRAFIEDLSTVVKCICDMAKDKDNEPLPSPNE